MRVRASAGLAAGLLLLAITTPAATQGRNRAAIVVRTPEETSSMCVLFDEDEITGADLLARSGFDAVTEPNALGTAVCSISGIGCPADDCFCRYPTFWGYWTDDGDGWTFSDAGSSDRVVVDGSADAWSFGRDGEPAPELGFDDVCAAGEETRAGDEPRSTDRPAGAPAYAPLAAIAGLLLAGGVAVRLRRRGR